MDGPLVQSSLSNASALFLSASLLKWSTHPSYLVTVWYVISFIKFLGGFCCVLSNTVEWFHHTCGFLYYPNTYFLGQLGHKWCLLSWALRQWSPTRIIPFARLCDNLYEFDTSSVVSSVAFLTASFFSLFLHCCTRFWFFTLSHDFSWGQLLLRPCFSFPLCIFLLNSLFFFLAIFYLVPNLFVSDT